MPLTGSGSSATVHFTSSLLFPGLQGHERLGRHMSLPPRATLFAADGTPLAEGPDRTSPIPDVASQIVGTLGPIPAADAATYAAEGYPANAQVGLDGLERVFQTQLAGTPGRRAAGRQARAGANRAQAPGTTSRPRSCPSLERAAIDALGDSYAGIVGDGPAHRRRCSRSPGSRSPPPSRPARR